MNQKLYSTLKENCFIEYQKKRTNILTIKVSLKVLSIDEK